MTTYYQYDPLWEAECVVQTTLEEVATLNALIMEHTDEGYRLWIIVEAGDEHTAYQTIEEKLDRISNNYSIGPVQQQVYE